MLKEDFDRWAKDYDISIEDHAYSYPLGGYHKVLSFVQDLIEIEEHTEILDIGIGTGSLTKELYDEGAKIVGLDFSLGMMKKVRERMPLGTFYHHDFTLSLPEELNNRFFHYIVTSYALHHLNREAKRDLIVLLVKEHLYPAGRFIMADITFESEQALKECKREAGEAWDDEETYSISHHLLHDLEVLNLPMKYTQLTPWSGVLEITKTEDTVTRSWIV